MAEEESSATLDLARLRVEYSQRTLSEKEVDRDPFKQFERWISEALAARADEPNAMTLATATRDGTPSARVVLLKGVDDRGLVFFTNYQSRKGEELAANPRAAVCFWWPELERQVRVEGTVERTSAEESEAYFNSRPPAARVGSAASPQSRPIGSREELVDREHALLQRFPDGNVPRPPHWGGYRLVPARFEFWQGGPGRLHDRVEYLRDEDATWTIQRLAP